MNIAYKTVKTHPRTHLCRNSRQVWLKAILAANSSQAAGHVSKCSKAAASLPSVLQHSQQVRDAFVEIVLSKTLRGECCQARQQPDDSPAAS
jgi:hypothetical protein